MHVPTSTQLYRAVTAMRAPTLSAAFRTLLPLRAFAAGAAGRSEDEELFEVDEEGARLVSKVSKELCRHVERPEDEVAEEAG
jgi:hypothetical protein